MGTATGAGRGYMAVIGFLLLVAAAVVAVAGIDANRGSAHALPGSFDIFGHHLTGTTAKLFAGGMLVGAVGAVGLCLLIAGVQRRARMSTAIRRDRTLTRRENRALTRERDKLAAALDAERTRATTAAATTGGGGGDGADGKAGEDGGDDRGRTGEPARRYGFRRLQRTPR
jgi:hypothetical protein